jgi:hypothetical protein
MHNKHGYPSRREEKKPSYQEELRKRCGQWWDEHVERSENPRPEDLFDFVKEIALDSFKNGVTVGKRKAQDRGDSGRDLVVEEE